MLRGRTQCILVLLPRILNLSFLFLLLNACSSVSRHGNTREPGSLSRHYIFFIHGIAGDATSAMAYPRALEKRLELENPDFDVLTFSPVYQTDSNTVNLLSSAEIIAAQIRGFISTKGGLAGNDKISIIAHSQGGVVALIWLYRSMSGHLGFSRNEALHVRELINLGTPYWGSSVANLTKYLKSAPVEWVQNKLNPWGLEQLNQMSLLSDSSYLIRDHLTNDSDPVMHEIRERIRVLSIAGAALGYSKLAAFGIGAKHFESDLIVSLPFANLAFLYGATTVRQLTVRSGVHLERKALGEFYVTDGTHNGDGSHKAFPGIGTVSEVCADDMKCRHPTLGLVNSFILGKKLPDNSQMLQKLTGFAVMLNFKSEKKLNLKDFEIDYQGGLFKGSKVNSFFKPELASKGSAASQSGAHHHARFWVTGYNKDTFRGDLPPTADDSQFSSRLIRVNWKHKGKRQAPLLLRVNATHVSFVDIDMDN